MKRDPMRENAPFIRSLALTLTVILLNSSLAGAVSPDPGSLAVLEPSIPVPEMRAAWDAIRNEVYLDPLLLVRGREEILEKLGGWRLAADAVRSAHSTANRITLDRVQAFLEEARILYYQFDYQRAADALQKAEDLLLTPGKSEFRSHLMFEVQLVSGMVARAAGSETYGVYFKKAAALDPDRELPPEKYSPETITIYTRLRNELLGGERVPLWADGSPDHVSYLMDGEAWGKEQQDQGFQVVPGIHFLELSAPGYEPRGLVLDAGKLEPVNIRYQLVPIGPEGDPEDFFLQRLRAGDRSYMAILAEKLGVDYLLIPDPDENVLKIWLLDRQGRSVEHAVLWTTGDTRESSVQRVSGLLKPIRQKWDQDSTSNFSALTLPAPDRELPEGNGSSTWGRYGLAIGVLIMLGVAAKANGSGSSRIEVAW